MENKKEMTALKTSVGADERQRIYSVFSIMTALFFVVLFERRQKFICYTSYVFNII